MLARLRAVMRRLVPMDENIIFKVGKLSVDIASRKIEFDREPVRLTQTEYNILKILVINAGKVVTHREILKEVWDKSEDFEGVSHLLRVTVSNLRNKIEPDPDRPIYILTEPAVGYRL